MLVVRGAVEVDDAQVSRLLFGRACRVPLAVWILESEKGRFYQSEPPPHVGASTAVKQELSRFVALGMLAQERPDGENRVYYVRTDSSLWEIIRVVRNLTD